MGVQELESWKRVIQIQGNVCYSLKIPEIQWLRIPRLQGYDLKTGLNLRYCDLCSQEPSTMVLLEAAVVVHLFLLILGASLASGLSPPSVGSPSFSDEGHACWVSGSGYICLHPGDDD